MSLWVIQLQLFFLSLRLFIIKILNFFGYLLFVTLTDRCVKFLGFLLNDRCLLNYDFLLQFLEFLIDLIWLQNQRLLPKNWLIDFYLHISKVIAEIQFLILVLLKFHQKLKPFSKL